MATVLITGSSTGLGLATAVALARAGHDVYATMRNPARSPELQTIARKESLPISILRLDVDRDESVMQAVRQVLAERGHVDVLVNNAGILAFGAVEDLPLDVFRQAMETNYFGALRCIQAVLPSMRERRSGCIVNVTSIGGRITMGAHGCYTATKFALEALSEALAQEVKACRQRSSTRCPNLLARHITRTKVASGLSMPPRFAMRCRRSWRARRFATSSRATASNYAIRLARMPCRSWRSEPG